MVQGGKKANGAECKSHMVFCKCKLSRKIQPFNIVREKKFALGANTFEIYLSGAIGTFGVPKCYSALQNLFNQF